MSIEEQAQMLSNHNNLLSAYHGISVALRYQCSKRRPICFVDLLTMAFLREGVLARDIAEEFEKWSASRLSMSSNESPHRKSDRLKQENYIFLVSSTRDT